MPLLAWLARVRQREDRYRWYALASTSWCQAAAVSLTNAVGPLAPLLQADFGISRAEIGLTLTSVAFSSALVALAGGRIADQVGERRVLIISGLVASLAGLTIGLVGSFWAFLAISFVIGLGSGIQNPAGSAAVMRWFPPRLRGLAMGLRQTGVPVGGILAASVWPGVALIWGWRAAYVVGGLATLLGAALIVLVYRDPPRGAGPGAGKPLSFGKLLRNPQVWWLGLIFNAQVLAQFTVTTYFVLFLHEVLDIPVVTAAGLLALLNVVAIGARIAWGLLSDRRFRGERRPVLAIILALSLISMLGAAALPAGAPLPIAAGLAVLLGISVFAWTGLLGTLIIERLGRESAATAIAVVSALGSPGQLFGPPLFGLLVDRTGSYQVAWLATALVVLIGVLASGRLSEHAPA